MKADDKRYINGQTYYAETRLEELVTQVAQAATLGEAVTMVKGAQREIKRHTSNIRKKIEFGEE